MDLTNILYIKMSDKINIILIITNIDIYCAYMNIYGNQKK